MVNWDTVREWVVSGLVQNFTWMLIAIFFAQFVTRIYERTKYGRWRVVVRKREQEVVDREISPGKVKEILSEPAEMSVFLKGVASPYGWINCDVLTEGRRLGLFTEDRANRRLVIDLDKNPKVERDDPAGDSQSQHRA